MSTLFNKSSGRSNEFYLDSQLLINGVKKRPILYDCTLKDFKKSKAKKREAWLEICEEIMPNWHNFIEEEQEFCENELQKKWRNMRDCYTKEYKKRINQCGSKKGIKTYVYYDAMSFLLPIAQRRHPTTDQKDDDNFDKIDSESSQEIFNDAFPNDAAAPDEDTMEMEFPTDAFTKDDLKPLKEIAPTSSNSRRSINRIKITSTTNNLPTTMKKSTPQKNKSKYKRSMGKMLEHLEEQIYNTDSEERDPDEMFLLSLLPLWKKMTDDTKLSAQIDVLRLVQNRLNDQN